MSIAIKTIRIHKSGPLDSISFDLGKLNLFFGHNESGKTYLVEFILQCLFRHRSHWALRNSVMEGSLDITGLGDKPIRFTPDSTKRIEDYWEEDNTGLPRNLARLLVIKGGELNLGENTPGGVDRAVLKTALTSQEIFDQIRERIPTSVRNASLIESKIVGHNRGMIKDHNSLTEEVAQIQSLIELVEETYSRGPAKVLENRVIHLEQVYQQQIKAKRHQAYQLSERHKALTAESELYSDLKLSDLRDSIRDHRVKKKEINSLSLEIDDLKKDSQDYSWLRAAREIWDTQQLEDKAKPTAVPGYLGLALLTAGIITLILNKVLFTYDAFWLGIAAGVLGGSITIYHFQMMLSWSRSRNASLERIEIQKEFIERFGHSPTNLADIKAQLDSLHEKYLIQQNLQNQLESKRLDLNQHSLEIDSLFYHFQKKNVKEPDWDRTYQDLQAHSEKIKQSLHDLEVELIQLDIPESDHLEHPTGQSFDPELVEEIENELSALKMDMAQDHQELERLKARVTERIGDEIDKPWAEVYYGLLEHRDGLENELKELKAEIAAKIGLTEILDRIQSEEDQKIIQQINSSTVTDLISGVTGRYQNIDLTDNQLFLEDKYRRYALKDLSTGAIEQIQLGLRVGIASLAAGNDPLFMILDDAFQGSDWQRREILVSQMVELVKRGWQVTYLTMDNQLRDLFLKAGEAMAEKDFKYYLLN